LVDGLTKCGLMVIAICLMILSPSLIESAYYSYVIALLFLDITLHILPEINWLLFAHALLFSLLLLCFCFFGK